jgi:vacuolar-type H+-ATPase subunit I/STV1
MADIDAEGVGVLAILGTIVWVIAAWITHVVVCLKAGTWGFLIAGAIFFPVAVIHGTGIWFGAF